jgi:hypothetical protein
MENGGLPMKGNWYLLGNTTYKERKAVQYKIQWSIEDTPIRCNTIGIPHLHKAWILLYQPTRKSGWYTDWEVIYKKEYVCLDIEEGINTFISLQESDAFTAFLESILMENIL